MDHLMIPIPEGLDPAQKADLTDRLQKEVVAALSAQQAALSEGMKRAMQDIESGRVVDSAEAIRQLDKRIGFSGRA